MNEGVIGLNRFINGSVNFTKITIDNNDSSHLGASIDKANRRVVVGTNHQRNNNCAIGGAGNTYTNNGTINGAKIIISSG